MEKKDQLSFNDIKSVAEVVQLQNENSKLKKQVAEQVKKETFTPAPEFDVRSALEQVNPAFVEFASKELSKTQNPKARFKELQENVPNFTKTKNYESSILLQEGQMLKKNYSTPEPEPKRLTPLQKDLLMMEDQNPGSLNAFNTQLRAVLKRIQDIKYGDSRRRLTERLMSGRSSAVGARNPLLKQ